MHPGALDTTEEGAQAEPQGKSAGPNVAGYSGNAEAL